MEHVSILLRIHSKEYNQRRNEMEILQNVDFVEEGEEENRHCLTWLKLAIANVIASETTLTANENDFLRMKSLHVICIQFHINFSGIM